jgi:hypothetical protein
MDESHHDHTGGVPLSERLWDLLVYVPAGIATAVVEDFPSLAERGRRTLGVRVSSARAVGQFAVQVGQDQLRRRTGVLRAKGTSTPVSGAAAPAGTPEGQVGDAPGDTPTPSPSPAPTTPTAPTVPPAVVGHVPAVSTLSIPGFDTLSASQVVQRLDGLNRSELVSVRTYESSTRGRRTILSRVDQLLDERS